MKLRYCELFELPKLSHMSQTWDSEQYSTTIIGKSVSSLDFGLGKSSDFDFDFNFEVFGA
jgi:hypothetical protein